MQAPVPDDNDLLPYEPESLTDLEGEFGDDFDFRMGATDQLPHATFKGDASDLVGEDFMNLRDKIIMFKRRVCTSP
jgi:hypothetical protein